MNYDFTFTKKTLSFLLAGLGFVGIMLFITGLLIGTNWNAEPKAANGVAAKQTPAAAQEPAAPPAAPQEPVLRADAARPVAPSDADAASDAPAPVKQAHSNPARFSSNRWQTYTPAPENDGELKIIEEAEASPDNVAAEMSSFSVQVGAFVDENDARQLVRQLQKKGYTPIVLAASDDESRLWYAVRIGTYTNKAEAAHAATNIELQEKLKAIVRPLGSL
jgi:cell division septation protein DedD